MVLKAGLVGLPNVGKSTLFNALTQSYAAESANYPFCTIEPNTGIVKLNDARMLALQKITLTNKVIPATFEFVDIAGLVKGANKGEGLGNQFLATIREVDAVVHVVRCFEDENILHVEGTVDPVRDVDTIFLELCLADVGSLEKRLPKLQKSAKLPNSKREQEELALFEKILPSLKEAEALNWDAFNKDEQLLLKSSGLLSVKPVIYAANVAESDLANPEANPHYMALKQKAEAEGRPVAAVSAQIEAELVGLEDEAERLDYLQSLGVNSSGMDALIWGAFTMLGLRTYFTAGVKEVRAWPFAEGFTAPQCAGVIHTDFEKGFIRAEVIAYADYVACAGEKGAQEKGLLRLEGKEYLAKDGDVMHFRFNV
jgi:ribosome-binding ATPase